MELNYEVVSESDGDGDQILIDAVEEVLKDTAGLDCTIPEEQPAINSAVYQSKRKEQNKPVIVSSVNDGEGSTPNKDISLGQGGAKNEILIEEESKEPIARPRLQRECSEQIAIIPLDDIKRYKL